MSDEGLFGPRDRRWVAVVAVVVALLLIAVGGALLLRDGDDGRRTAFDPGPETPSASPTP